MDNGLIYLNNAATSWPKPPEVMAEVQQSLRLPFYEEGRTTLEGQIDYPSCTREILAAFFHAPDPSHLIFSQNATDSLNTAIHGFAKRMQRPFHVITTELEHNAVLRPLRTLEQERKITLSIVGPRDGYIRPDSVKEAITGDTCLVVMTHGSNVLGTVQDIGRIGKYLRDQEIFFVVDGAQTAGHIPIDLGAVPCDVFAFTGHKALFGLPGIGGFHITDPLRIAPVKQGGTGIGSSYPFHTEEMPYRFEAGTHNYPGIASLYAGIRYIQKAGLSHIGKVTEEMTSYLLGQLRKENNIRIHQDLPDLPIIAFSVQGIPPDDVGFILARMYSIICRTGLHCAPLVHQRIDGGAGCVRFSLSCLNTMDQCRTAAEAIREVAQSADREIHPE